MPAAEGHPDLALAGTIETIEEHQARSQPHLLGLRMIARDDADTMLTRRVVVQIAQAAQAVLTEAETAARAAADVSGAAHAADILLRVRLTRLAAAADDAIAAAGAGDCALTRRALNRFDALTTAIWTVEKAVYDAARKSVKA